MISESYVDKIKAYLFDHFSLNEQQVAEMLPNFITTLSGHMANLAKAQASGNLEIIGKTGHTIKGAFLNLGLVDCAEIALQIEHRAKAGDTTVDYARLIAELDEKVDAIVHGR